MTCFFEETSVRI